MNTFTLNLYIKDGVPFVGYEAKGQIRRYPEGVVVRGAKMIQKLPYEGSEDVEIRERIGRKQYQYLRGLIESGLSTAQIDVLLSWLEHRKQLGKPLTRLGIARVIKDLREDFELTKHEIGLAIQNGWQGYRFERRKPKFEWM